ncbi:MAG: hypothetical protein RLZZ519_2574 [Bacteroidota bacterium]|jgi:hypothetical protein
MGLFDLFQRKGNQPKPAATHYSVKVYSLFSVTLPVEWVEYKSDRFRTRGMRDGVQFSISAYSKPMQGSNTAIIESELREQSLGFFRKFVVEGGFEANNDLELKKDSAYQSFKVDEETQYFYYTYRIIGKELIRISFILRDMGAYSAMRRKQILAIGKSIVS